MEKYPLKGNNKSIALQSLVGSPKKSTGASGNSSSSSTGVTYQSVNKNKKVMCPFFHLISIHHSHKNTHRPIDLRNDTHRFRIFVEGLRLRLNCVWEIWCETDWMTSLITFLIGYSLFQFPHSKYRNKVKSNWMLIPCLWIEH